VLLVEAGVVEPLTQAQEAIQRLERQRASAEAFAAAIQNWTVWSGKSLSLVNIYGFFAANAWLPAEGERYWDAGAGENGVGGGGGNGKARLSVEEQMLIRLEVGLSSQAQQLLSYDRPFPIYTAVRVKEIVCETGASKASPLYDDVQDGGEELGTQYQWYEWTAYDFYSSDSGQSIPVWAFGRKFEEGISVSVCPEMSLSILFGVWGAAFTANASEVLRSLTGLGIKKQQQVVIL